MTKNLKCELQKGDTVINSESKLGVVTEVFKNGIKVCYGDDNYKIHCPVTLKKIEASAFTIIPHSSSFDMNLNFAKNIASNFCGGVICPSDEYYALEDSVVDLLNGKKNASIAIDSYAFGLYNRIVGLVDSMVEEANDDIYQDVYEKCMELDDEPTDDTIREMYYEVAYNDVRIDEE